MPNRKNNSKKRGKNHYLICRFENNAGTTDQETTNNRESAGPGPPHAKTFCDDPGTADRNEEPDGIGIHESREHHKRNACCNQNGECAMALFIQPEYAA